MRRQYCTPWMPLATGPEFPSAIQGCLPREQQKPRPPPSRWLAGVLIARGGGGSARREFSKARCLADLVLHDVVVGRLAGVRAVLVSARYHVRAVDRANLRLMPIRLAGVVAVLIVSGFAGGESGGRDGCQGDCEKSAFHDYVPFGWLVSDYPFSLTSARVAAVSECPCTVTSATSNPYAQARSMRTPFAPPTTRTRP